jgi:hypothetical protein
MGIISIHFSFLSKNILLLAGILIPYSDLKSE